MCYCTNKVGLCFSTFRDFDETAAALMAIIKFLENEMKMARYREDKFKLDRIAIELKIESIEDKLT